MIDRDRARANKSHHVNLWNGKTIVHSALSLSTLLLGNSACQAGSIWVRQSIIPTI
jgi:hypothetical protein